MSRNNPGLITFKRKDEKPDYINEATLEFAQHFQVKREYLRDFFGLIRTSKYWKKATLNDNIDNWKARFPKYRSAKRIIELVEKWFSKCEDDQGINDLRGAIAESFVLAYVMKIKSYKVMDENFGWGAKVMINLPSGKETVHYSCTTIPKPSPSCSDRYTVDVGYWDGYHGKFYECKISPASIGCKEMKYMERLHDKLLTHHISHEIFFVFLDSSDGAEMIIQDYNSEFPYKLIGAEELREMLSA